METFFQELEARNLLGCIKVSPCILMRSLRSDLVPRDVEERWPLSSWGKEQPEVEKHLHEAQPDRAASLKESS